MSLIGNFLSFIPSLFAVYLSNEIYGKVLLSALMVFFILTNIADVKNKILATIIFLLSLYIPYVIIFLALLPFSKSSFWNKVLFNTVAIRLLVENSYFLGISEVIYFYYLWGLPLIALAIIGTKLFSKIFSYILLAFLLCTLLLQIKFNVDLSKKNIYVPISKESIVANYNQLKSYFPKLQSIATSDLKKVSNSYIILPIAENKEIVQKNVIVPNNTYLLLAEHDNLNNFLPNYSYFNNDAHRRGGLWKLFKPNFISSLDFIVHKDIFYSSNIGSSVIKGYPIIWEYDKYGRPIILASLQNINNSKVFLWGDSDFFVNKLVPYNISMVEYFVSFKNYGYYICVIFYMLSMLCILLHHKSLSLLFLLIYLIGYHNPINFSQIVSKINLFSDFHFYSAHNISHVSSFPNIVASKNLNIKVTNQNPNVFIIQSSLETNKSKYSQLFYLMSNASLSIEAHKYECTSIKIGTEQSKQRFSYIYDARLLKKDGKLTSSSTHNIDNSLIVCTGSPQLNTHLIDEVIIHEK